MSHVSLPLCSSSVGKMASMWDRRDQFSGVSTSMLRSARVGDWGGMLTGSGPRKIVFSTLAETEDVLRVRRHIKTWKDCIVVFFSLRS